MTLLTINGHKHFFRRVVSVTKVDNHGKYDVKTTIGFGDGDTYRVEGGRKAGGAHNEWMLFMSADRDARPIWCTSLVAALKVLDTL
jgi:hypothetical protein